jgi:hypothetical protein
MTRNASISPLENKLVGAKKLELKNQAGGLDKASYLLEKGSVYNQSSYLLET